jgi:hypothetical protein
MKRLSNWLFGSKRPDEEETAFVEQPEESPPELFKLHKGDVEAKIVGLPNGATADQIERLTLIQMAPGTSPDDCQDFLRAIQDALPPHEAKNIIVTMETNIQVFKWKKVEDSNDG